MNEHLLYKRKHVTALVTGFLEQMKERYPDKKYFGKSDLERDLFYSEINLASLQSQTQLENKDFLSLDIEALSSIEELFTKQMSRLNFSVPGAFDTLMQDPASQYPGRTKSNTFEDVWKKTVKEFKPTVPDNYATMDQDKRNKLGIGWAEDIAKSFGKNYMDMVGINGITTDELKKLLWDNRSLLEKAGIATGGAALEAAINAIVASMMKGDKTVMLWMGVASATITLDKDYKVKEFKADGEVGPVSANIDANVEKKVYEWDVKLKQKGTTFKVKGKVNDKKINAVSGEVTVPLGGGKLTVAAGAAAKNNGDLTPTGTVGFEWNIDNINFKINAIQELNNKGQVNQQINFGITIPINILDGKK
jgi:hypothetical protein